MIVENKGYLKLEEVLNMIEFKSQFSIYETNKGTNILVLDAFDNNISLYYPKMDRLPWKITEGNSITYGAKKIFDSKINTKSDLNTSKWNNQNQIMLYVEYGVNPITLKYML